MNITKLNCFRNSWNTIGSLRENERLFTTADQVSKYQNPSAILKDRKESLLRLIHKVLTLVMTVIQAISRKVNGQTAERNIAKVEQLAKDVLEMLKGPASEEVNSHLMLQKLSDIRRGMLGKGWGHLAEQEEDRRLIEKIKKQIDDEIVPLLDAQIEGIESTEYAGDKIKAAALLERVQADDVEESALESVLLSKKAVCEVLSEAYGKQALERTLTYYHLKHQTVLTGIDVAAIVIGTVANLTHQDLVALEGAGHDEAFLLGKLQTLRQIRHLSLSVKTKRYKDQLQHDLLVLKAIQQVPQFDPSKTQELDVKSAAKFSYAEFLARDFSYALFNKSTVKFADGLVFPLYDSQGEQKLMEAHSLVSHKGLHGLVVKAVWPQNDATLQVVFRGTQCKDSIIRDFIHYLFDGPGRDSFAKWEERISQGIMCHVKTPCSLEFIGHSLGACDAMRSLEALARRMKGDSFTEVQLFAFNTPSVESDIAKQFIQSVSKLSIPFKLRYLDVHHDPVQEFGAKRLGYCGAAVFKPKNLKISIYKFNRENLRPIQVFILNLLAKTQFFFKRSFNAHTHYCLKYGDTFDSAQPNPTFIQNIYTNNPEDVNLLYGQGSKELSLLDDQELIEDELVTEMARIGRKIKRISHKTLGFLTLGKVGLYAVHPAGF